MMPVASVLGLDFDVVCGDAAHRIIRAAAACVGGEMPEDRSAHFAARRQTEARIRIIEGGFDAGAFAVEEIACEMFAARRAHRIGLEQRALYLRITVLAEAIPRIRRRLFLFVQQVLEQLVDCILHGITTSRAVFL
jgi:hypothetical protein